MDIFNKKNNTKICRIALKNFVGGFKLTSNHAQPICNIRKISKHV